MTANEATEQAYKNGYEDGYRDGKNRAMEDIAFPKFLARPPQPSKEELEDIMRSPVIVHADAGTITPIYPYRWISVKEGLPKPILCDAGTAYSEAVNVLTTGRKVLTAIWDGFDWICDAEFWDAEGEEITHWAPVPLPLPEPPWEDKV